MQPKWGIRGMAVAPHSLASQSALAVLREGGNALEAMISAAATIAVVYPHMNSIGGDSFWVIHAPGKAMGGIDACGAAAGLATRDWYQDQGITGAIPFRGAVAANTVAGIFAGQILYWDDPKISADTNRTVTTTTYKKDANGNPVKDKKGNLLPPTTKTTTYRLTLPHQKITVIYRADSSGTSENFTNYLNKSAPTVWTKSKNKVFKDSFPGDINSMDNLGRIVGAQSSNGVSQLAGKTKYSITYAEVNYAAANSLKVASLLNPAGNAVAPDNTGVGAFLASATQDANGFLTYDFTTKEPGAYPLGIVSYLLADTKYPDKTKAAAVKDFATYILSSKCSKDVGTALGFSVIDGDLLKKSLAQVAKIG